jgi:hypothetical protein
MYSQVVSNQPLVEESNWITNLNSAPCVAACEPKTFVPPVEFLSSLVGCLTDLFSLPLHKESPSKTSFLINHAIQKHFGVTLTASSINKIIPNSTTANLETIRRAPNVSMPAPSPDVVFSNDEELGCLSVDDSFKLVSDSDMSEEDGVDGGVKESASPGKRKGRGKNGIKPQSLESLPIPSPVLGHGKKTHKDKEKSATVNSTRKIGPPNTRQRSQK